MARKTSRGFWRALLKWLDVLALSELRRSFGVWMREVLLPARVPGEAIPQGSDLQEVKSMLAERVVEWTQEWKREGFEEGLQQGIEKTVEVFRATLLAKLEERFGALPDGVRRRVGSLGSAEELGDLLYRSGTAPSLASLGLARD